MQGLARRGLGSIFLLTSVCGCASSGKRPRPDEANDGAARDGRASSPPLDAGPWRVADDAGRSSPDAAPPRSKKTPTGPSHSADAGDPARPPAEAGVKAPAVDSGREPRSDTDAMTDAAAPLHVDAAADACVAPSPAADADTDAGIDDGGVRDATVVSDARAVTHAATPPSCVSLARNCGHSRNADCCASSIIPGGTYDRSDDAHAPATVSDFRLDTYEVTVGRFRRFHDAYSQDIIPAGAGRNPNDPEDPGWDVSWNTNLPADRDALVADVQWCSSSFAAYTDAPGPNETKPIACIDWYEAFAFCAWDGGRLPTEAEWNYAATGGSEQRTYPWGETQVGADTTLAIYGCYYDGTGTCTSEQNSAPVGSAPAGDGRWGQADLGGSVWEWVLDWYAPYSEACSNCADLEPTKNRVLRGGSFYDPLTYLATAYRANIFDPTVQAFDVGVRCARDP